MSTDGRSPGIELVAELRDRLDANPDLAAAFAALTPGRQREYNFHVSGAKRAATRISRVDRCVPKILAGRGLRDPDGSSPRKKLVPGDGVVLLAGGNPQIAKGDGRGPVAAYLDAVPGWKQDVARTVDRAIVESVPDVAQAVRWNSPFYGVEGAGWFASYHCFDRYLKVTFLNGARLVPLPPVEAKDPDARYLHLHEGEEIDEDQLRSWMAQAAAVPGWDGF